MQVTNFFDISYKPVINAIVATTAEEEQLLALFEDLTDADRTRVLHFVDSLLSAYKSSH
ncbi:MAG: hypothetical protein HY847_16960 [Betaproteobacteria bacterium]|nr:hypothetical protein [Betaproteobacteria bacterium]